MDIDRYLARISKAKKGDDNKLSRERVLGTGFIISPPYLVTCHHVMADLANAKEDEEIEPGILEGIVVDFPVHPELSKNLYAIELLISKPQLKNPEYADLEDIAIFKLHQCDDIAEQSALSIFFPAIFTHYCNHQISIKGFHIDKSDQLPNDGRSISVSADGRIQLNFDKLNDSIAGASGAPVWSDTEQAVIGMLVSQRDEKARFASDRVYMIPMCKIIQSYVPLKGVIDSSLTIPIANNSYYLEDIEAEIKAILNSSISLQSGLIRKYRLNQESTTVHDELLEVICNESKGDIPRLVHNIYICVRDGLKKYDKECPPTNAKNLIDDSKKLVTLLTTLSQKTEQQDHLQSSSLNMMISGEELGIAELKIAQRIQARPKFRVHNKKPYVVGEQAIANNEFLELGIKEGEIVEGIETEFWKKVFPKHPRVKFVPRDRKNKSRMDYETRTEDQINLGKHIQRELLADDLEKKNYYLLSKNVAGEPNYLENPEVRAELKQKLPELPVVALRNDSNSEGPASKDQDLMAEIFNFYQLIDTYPRDNFKNEQQNPTTNQNRDK